MSPGQGSPFGGGSLLALAAMVAAGFTNLFKQLRRCQRFAYFPKHREMVLFGSAWRRCFPIQDHGKQLSATPRSTYGFL